MKIRLAENGLWGGVIPDVIRNNEIAIKFGDNLRLDLSGKEFDHLKTFLTEETQNWFVLCQKIVKNDDKKDDIFRKYYGQMEELLSSRNQWYEMQTILMNFYNDYWEADRGEALNDILPIDKPPEM